MNSQSRKGSEPQLGATFYPGGVDDFYIPELISPAPQRSMPEVPQQIQENLAHLELEATGARRFSGTLSPDSTSTSQAINGPLHPRQKDASMQAEATRSLDQIGTMQSIEARALDFRRHGELSTTADQPSFSPFPPIRQRPQNVPPSDTEKEYILENARLAVLHSNDPEMQLTWAQDALSYVDIAMASEARMSELRSARPRTPQAEHQLRIDSVNIVTFLADQHHPKAEFLRGLWLEFGKFGFRMDKREAWICYKRAAAGGYARAEYRIGMQFENSNDINNAIKHFALGVAAHDSAANYRLGMMLLLGQHGQRQDYRRGLEMIRFSAETADENAPQGAFVYGMLQARELYQVTVPDEFLPLDVDSALYHIEKAAYLGFAKAQTKMGTVYEHGHFGCEFDPALSLHYNNLAARQGDPDAEMAISKWFLSGCEGSFKKSEEMAFTYAQRAAQTGLATAEFAMGYYYEVGIHVPVSLKEASVWYGKAAQHGSQDAAARIEGITRSKTLTRKDHDSIAVAKINSARASRYGNRPQRLTKPSLPAMPDTPPIPANPYGTVSMPEVGPSFQSYAIHGPNLPSASTSPYTDSPYTGSTNMPPRPLPSDGSYRSGSAATAGAVPQNNSIGTTSPDPINMQRPLPAMSSSGHNGGRGASSQLVKPVSTPLNATHKSQGYNVSTEGSLPDPNSTRQKYESRQKPLPPIELGFTAPPDLAGADRKKRLQNSDDQGASSAAARRANMPRPDRISSQLPTVIPAQSRTSDERTTTPALATRPPRNASLPVRPAPAPSAPSNQTTTPYNTANSTPAPPAMSNAGGRRPGKGPSTFEEMGVPQGKKDDECVVM